MSSEPLKKNSFPDHCKIPSTLHWNVKISHYRFSFWWVLGFVIPPRRQLVFPERVWLLAERDDARNITIWPASRHALLTHMHTWKNNEVTGTVHFKLSTSSQSRHEPMHTCACKHTAGPHGSSQSSPLDRRRKIYAHTEGPRRGSGDQGYSKALISSSQPDNSLPAWTPDNIFS